MKNPDVLLLVAPILFLLGSVALLLHYFLRS